MKKTILILVVLGLLIPASAFAATEFSLGGFIKLDAFWDSAQTNKNLGTAISRNNDSLFQHGHATMVAQGSRFNFTIKGPKLWGATTTGFIEMDFDQQTDTTQMSSSHSYIPRLRHAMFRLNWPETELLFGQYWAMTNEYSPETAQDAGLNFHGTSTHRLAQIRLTQKFLGDWTVAGLIGQPTDPSTADANNTTAVAGNQNAGTTLGLEGQSSETPQLQAKVAYEKDLWGKAPFYGRPRGFVAQVTGAWQRTRYRSNAAGQGLTTFGQNAFGTTNIGAVNSLYQNGQQYLDPWVIQGNLFIPVLPTYSNNLSGSASLSAQWYVGQGMSAFGYTRDNDNSWFDFSGISNVNGVTHLVYDRKLMKAFGGYVQGQYWFTNQWFMNVVWGFQRNFGVDRSQSGLLQSQVNGAAPATNVNVAGYKYAAINDQTKIWQEIDVALYYRPIEAIKFGLQYAYSRTDWLQKLNNPNNLTVGPNASIQPAAGATSTGEDHRVEFVAFLFF